MPQAVRIWNRAPHLAAAAIALATTVVLLWILFDVVHIEKRLAHLVAPELLPEKDEGVALQEGAFSNRHLLPIYGSSEFLADNQFAGRIFFANSPTGFELFPVGKAGAKTLIVALRIGALGKEVQGKKVVIILSPTWFLASKEGVAMYDGNFSALQASDAIFNSPLSHGLKRDLAREMLKFPETLNDHSLLRLGLERLAKGSSSPEDRLLMEVGRSEDDVMLMLDRWQSVFALSSEILRDPSGLSDPKATPKPRPDWANLMAQASKFAEVSSYQEQLSDPSENDDGSAARLDKQFNGVHREAFEARLNNTDEWGHLRLLLRTLHELGAKPLILSIPINATSFGAVGVTAEQRSYYYARLRNEVHDYHFPVATFQKYETNPNFFGDTMGHPSPMGWMTFNKTISQFYHDKLPANLD